MLRKESETMVSSNTDCIGQFAFCLVVSHYTLTLGAVLPGSQDHSEDRQWQGRCSTDMDGRVCGRKTNLFCEEKTANCLGCTENYCGEKIFDDSLCQQYCPAWFSKNKIQPTLPDVALPEVTDIVLTTSKVDYNSSLTENASENSVQTQSLESKAWYIYIAYVLLGIAIMSIIYLVYCLLTRVCRTRRGSPLPLNHIIIQKTPNNIITTCCVHGYAPAQTVDQHEGTHIRQPTKTTEECLPDYLTLTKAIPDRDSDISGRVSFPNGNIDSSDQSPSSGIAADSSSTLTVSGSGLSGSLNKDNGETHLTTHASARTDPRDDNAEHILPHPVPVVEGRHDLTESIKEIVTNF